MLCLFYYLVGFIIVLVIAVLSDFNVLENAATEHIKALTWPYIKFSFTKNTLNYTNAKIIKNTGTHKIPENNLKYINM